MEDIHNRLSTGAAGTQITFTEPISGPMVGTGHTLDEIMAVAPQVDDTNGAAAAQVVSGRTYWGLHSGAWGLQTGAAAAGSNVTGGDGQLTFALPDGFYTGAKTATARDADLVAGNIRSGANLFGVAGNPNVVNTASGDAAAGDILSGRVAWVDGSELAGSMPDNGAVTITPTTTSQTIAAGYHDGSGSVVGDADLIPANISSGVNLFGVDGAYPLASVSRTGQVISYTAGDDGDLEMGVDWITATRFITSTTGIVTDTLTGLIWLERTNCIAFSSGDVTGQNIRNWTAALTAANELATGFCGLTDGSSAGDWRLPNLRELHSLVDYGEYSNALPDGHPFIIDVDPAYWSSTTYAYNTSQAWAVRWGSGDALAGDKTHPISVWAVRGEQ
jgi:hypothetical protein